MMSTDKHWHGTKADLGVQGPVYRALICDDWRPCPRLVAEIPVVSNRSFAAIPYSRFGFALPQSGACRREVIQLDADPCEGVLRWVGVVTCRPGFIRDEFVPTSGDPLNRVPERDSLTSTTPLGGGGGARPPSIRRQVSHRPGCNDVGETGEVERQHRVPHIFWALLGRCEPRRRSLCRPRRCGRSCTFRRIVASCKAPTLRS